MYVFHFYSVHIPTNAEEKFPFKVIRRFVKLVPCAILEMKGETLK